MNFESFETTGVAPRKQSMKQSISFSTSLFETTADVDQKGGRLGADLAHWLVTKSSGSEFEFGEPSDAGGVWVVPVTAGSEIFEIGFSMDDAFTGKDEAEWAITVEKKRKWKLFGQQNSQMRAELCDLIQNILRIEPQISEVRWSD